MLAKIFSRTSTFNAVSYNNNKIDKTTGELMALKNFGILSDDLTLNPEDVKNYLKMHSMMNPNLKDAQLHAMISCKGREASKEKLTEIGHEWMKRMGYGDNPYIIVFHSDTDNNHIHIVSSRVDSKGETIEDSNEYYRSMNHLDNIIKGKVYRDPNDLTNLLEYKYSSVKQFQTLLESLGYNSTMDESSLNVFKGKKHVFTFSADDIEKRFVNDFDQKRKKQIIALISKYSKSHSTDLTPIHQKLSGNRPGKILGYHSELTDFMKDKFGFEFIFHFSEDKKPYGYTFIDHKEKQIFKGNEILKLQELINPRSDHKDINSERDLYLYDSDYSNLNNNPSNASLLESTADILASSLSILDISSDVDDEQVHGKERKKGKKR